MKTRLGKQFWGAVKTSLGNAEDNLYRANLQFGNMTEEELDKNYGQSGRSCRSIRDGYQQGCDHLKECVQWVESKL